MCLGIPRRVLSVDAPRGVAEVEVGADRQRVSIQMLQHADAADAAIEVGEWVVVHMGLAMEKMEEADALQTLQEIASLEDLDAWLVPPEGRPESNGPIAR